MPTSLSRGRLAPALAIALFVLAGCGGEEGDESTSSATPTIATIPEGDDVPEAGLQPPPCPAVDNCERAAGEIAFVERVDPDGDGDAHFVLLSSESITGPGLTVIDVRPELRPSPLPGPGDEIAASGPVFRGSYGQKQIQADAIRVGN